MVALRAQAEAQHAQMRKQDDALLSDLTRAYRGVYADLKPKLDAITAKIEAAIEAGEKPSASWLFQQGRLKQLEGQVIRELGEYGREAQGTIEAAQRNAVGLAQAHVQDMVGTSFSRLPTRAVEAMVGRTHSTDTPLSKVLDRYPLKAAEGIRKTLISSVALGRSPAETDRLLTKELGGKVGSYLTLARTEHASAYRAGSLESYRQNDNVIDGWVWIAGAAELSCDFCGPRDGRKFPLDEEFDTHPNCVCAALPSLKEPL